MRYRGKLRLATGKAAIDVCSKLDGSLSALRLPFLVMHGTADAICDISGSRRLLAEATAVDKTAMEYDGAVHTLLAEPEPRRAEILGALQVWLAQRAAA